MSSRASLNHIFRTVWNQALGAMVAVAETDSSGSGTSSRRLRTESLQRPPEVGIGLLALSIAIAWSALPTAAVANPTGGVSVVGQATFANSANKLLVTTQNGASGNYSAINWQSFSVPAGSATYFQQPNASSTSINRVVTNTPTQIFGTLSSNGNLVLVNQAGIAVGAGAVVDTNGFTASSLTMSDADAMAGRLRFGDGTISTSGVSVNGSILARSGDVVLLGTNVNTGVDALVQAANGNTVLAAGQQVEITARGLEGIRLQVQAPTDSAINLGTLKGDAVGMFAGTLKHSGLIQVSAATLEGGRVVLKASDLTEVAGTVTALGSVDIGGAIHVTGDKVLLKNTAVLDASGGKGGGEVLVGGGWHGQDSRISNAQVTLVGSGAKVKADALGQGDGGQVVVWSDGATRFGGTVSAHGGALGGNGGAAEVSGKHYLDFQGSADLRAPHGLSGNLLLDPATLTVAASGPSIDGVTPLLDLSLGSLLATDYSGANSIITAGAVATQLGYGNVTLEATGNININAPINWGGYGSRVLTINSTSSGSINATAAIASASSQFDVLMTAASGNISVGAITTFGGSVTLTSSNNVTMGAINTGAGNLAATATAGNITQTAALTIGGTSSFDSGGSITLTNAGNQFTGAVALDTGGSASASIRSSGDLVLGTSYVGGTLTVVSGGNVSAPGAAVSAATLDVTLDGFMSMTDSGNQVNTLKVTNNNVSTSTVSYFNNGPLSLGPISTIGDISISTSNGSNISQSGAATVGGYAYLSAGSYGGYGSLVMLNSANDFGTVSLQGSQVSLKDANALTVSSVYADTGGALIQSAGSLTLTGSMRTNASGNAVKLISGGTLDGYGGYITLDTAGARWLAYLATPSGDSFPSSYSGCCTPSPLAFKQYNATNGSTVLGAGNGVLYSTAPTLNASVSGSVSKIYDGSTTIGTSGAIVGAVSGTPLGLDDITSATGTLVSGTLSSPNVGSAIPVTFAGTVTGVVGGYGDPIWAGLPIYGYRFTANANIGTVTPATVSLNLSGSRVYDGTVSVAPGLYTLPTGVSLSGSGTSASKNVGTWGVSGFGLGGTSASNYTLGGVNITITPLAITGVSGIVAGSSREYDGTIKAPIDTTGAKLLGVVSTDNVVLDLSKVEANFKDPFWGSKKPIDITGLAISGADIANYTFDAGLSKLSIVGDIKQRALSTWKGGSSGEWAVASNWDALPVGDNVLAVNLGGANVTYSGSITKLNSLTGAGGLTVGGGSLTIGSGLSLAQFSQKGGSLEVASLTATSGFNQEAGTLTASGAVSGTRATGNLNVSGITAASVNLTATAGAITQSGPIVTPSLTTASATGTKLTGSDNKISAFTATNSGSGDIALANTGVLDISGMNNANGNITVDNIGGVTTRTIVGNGNVSFTANSPLTVGDGGITATGNVALTATNLTSSGNLTINGDVVSTGGSIALAAASDFAQNSTVNAAGGVTATAGGAMSFGPSAKTIGSPLSYSDAKGPVPAPGQAPQGSAPIDFVATFMSKFEDALLAQNGSTGDPAEVKKKDKDVVVEGQSCTR